MKRVHGGRNAVLNLLKQQIVQVPFDLDAEIDSIRQLLSRYESVPMSLADGCLVRMAESYPASKIMTLDSDFRVYRKHRNQIISLIQPDSL